MTLRTLIRRSLRHHWRAHLGVVLGAAIGSAALIGALVVGDSVKGSLRERALNRLGPVSVVLNSGDRFFQAGLLERIKAINAAALHSSNGQTPNRQWVPSPNGTQEILETAASVSRSDGGAHLNRVRLLGLDQDSMRTVAKSSANNQTGPSGASGVWISEALARQLQVKPGDTVLFRIPRPSALSREVAISARNDASMALRLEVAGISRAWLASFNPHSDGKLPLNALVSRSTLETAMQITNRANVLLAETAWSLQRAGVWQRFNNQNRLYRHYGRMTNANLPASLKFENPLTHFDWLKQTNTYSVSHLDSFETAHMIQPWLEEALTLQDLQYEWVKLPAAIELRTSRVFVDPPVADAARGVRSNAQQILTYLANLLHAGTNETPYSMVTAARDPWTPPDMKDDQIIINQWLAEDLKLKPGDLLEMNYFDPQSGAQLLERTNRFTVHSIVPNAMPWADRTLMPSFPGIEKAESTSEWDAGLPLTYKVREKDDDYWKKFRGTPKAFITLAAGQKMWGNRFGKLTGIRFPVPADVASAFAYYREPLEREILTRLDSHALGLRFEPVREQALKAAEESQDFGGLFLGFSFFVIAAALLLMVLLFSLGLEQRAPEIGTLLALGFTPQQVRKLLLREAVVLSLIGGVIGALGGLAYAKLMLHGLTTVWRDAVGATALNFHYTGQTLAIGIFASTVVSVITIWLALRKFVKRPARELLVGEVGAEESKVQSLKSKVFAVVALSAGMGMVGWAVASGETANAGIFFGAGALVLVAGLSFASSRLMALAGGPLIPTLSPTGERENSGAPLNFGALALRGCARRRKRSLATIAMLACGSFLIVSIGVFRLDANRDATKQSSGTGGFALIGETTMPVVHDLNTSAGRDFFALNEAEVKDVNFVPFRVRAGDEASCLNLNAAQRPRLLGVKPEMLEGRFGFTKNLNEMTKIGPWSSLERLHLSVALDKEEIAAIGDANSIQWAMHKKVGDTIDYVDERGQPFKVRIVGAVANSILQGQLIIDEAEFVKRFPGESGYRMFLIDAPSNAVAQVSAALSRAMQDVGLELTPAAQRLAQFNAVQNTYLGTFQVLGGLGLLLGSVGLGIVVLRNVLERRGELALLLAVGFRKPQVQRLLLLENGALLAAGLALGVLAAAVAVLPALLSPSAELPYASLAVTLGAVLTNGALWTWAATRLAVRGDLLGALRNE